MHTTLPVLPAVASLRVCETIDQVRELQEPLPADAPYAPDWIVSRVVDLGPGQYRWYVVGLNANCKRGEYGREFIWEVPSLCWRFDLTNAALVSTKHEAIATRVRETADGDATPA
jgi:hypothetical protein